ncbi:MAG: SPOR domain-containing protein [Proteobacteria bacterium]|nr:SPOR domain-containing protein [Pseudomonadota bacterium]MBU1450437.1 SPOR domain-containing protein [Pseudomonadota bacterium]MBU2470379.1 SPOR domain-containing protein [Pseudomonadota bacterium]MBU2517741.1 SPOR domain-containing protein [Pseudomonadota bacterium]
MSALILLVLLAGGVLYLGGGLFYLYRYLQARRMHPQAPRMWDGTRRRFLWLAGVGAVMVAGFVCMAWWSPPGPMDLQARATGQEAAVGSETLPPPQAMVRGPVPAFSETPETTSTTTTTTTSTTTTTESTASTSTTLAPKPVKNAARSQGRGAWTVCAASFRRESVAQGYAQRLAKQGLPARVNLVDLGKRGTWHRVCVGSFTTLDEARGQYKAWEKQGLISDAFLLPLR